MKVWAKVVSSVFMLAFLAGCATNSHENILDEDYSYTHIGEAEGLSKDELYDIAEFWVARNYRSANDVIQLKNKEQGRLVVRGIWVIPVMLNQANIHHVLQIDVRDEAYRLGFDQLVYQLQGSANRVAFEDLPSHLIETSKSGASENIENTIRSFEEAIKNQATDDDW